MLKLSVCPASPKGPAEMPVAKAIDCGPASSFDDCVGGTVNVGGSLTGVTLMVNVRSMLVLAPPLAVPPLSESVTVIVALPLRCGAGVKVNVPADESAGWAEKRA